MKIALASDHAGVDLKNQIKDYLQQTMPSSVFDLGAFTKTSSDYPDFAVLIGEALTSKTADRGILICGSGVGASIAANKIRGIRAGLCHDSYSARQGVEHDDMNVLVLGARVVGSSLATDLVATFLAATFSGEDRHVRRLNKVLELDSRIASSK